MTLEAGKRKADLVEQLSRRLQSDIPARPSASPAIIDNVTEAVTGSAADLA